MNNLTSHHQLEDHSFLDAFASQQLPPALFNHEAHLRLAYLHIKKYGLAQAELNIHQQIFAYVQTLGAADKYHKTLTIAATKTMHHFMQRVPEDTFNQLLQRFPRLNNNLKELITAHYSSEIFYNERARKQFIEPDLLPYS